IKAALCRKGWKQISVLAPLAQHGRFLVPLATFTHQGHRQQLTITARRSRPWPLKERRNLLPHIVHYYIHPQAKIVKVLYHWFVSLLGPGKFGNLTLPNKETACLFNLI